jgi:hypothetical protein
MLYASYTTAAASGIQQFLCMYYSVSVDRERSDSVSDTTSYSQRDVYNNHTMSKVVHCEWADR